MLIHLMTCGSDYEKSLKQRRLYFLAMLCVGLIGLVCYILLVPGSSLSDYAQGFYLGAASGIVAGALILLIRTQRLLSNPEARKKAKIKETDEREVQILHEVALAAGMITFFSAAAALFVVLPLSLEAYYALLGMVALYTLSFVVLSFVLPKIR